MSSFEFDHSDSSDLDSGPRKQKNFGQRYKSLSDVANAEEPFVGSTYDTIVTPDDANTSYDSFPKKKTSMASRWYQLAKPELLLLFLGTIGLFISSATFLAIPVIAGWIVDQIINESGDVDTPKTLPGGYPMPTLTELVLILVVIFVIGAFFTFVRGTLFTVAGERVVARMRRDLFASIMRQEVAFFDQSRTGDLTNRLSSDTQTIQNAVTVNISMGLRYVCQSIGSLAFLLFISWKLTIVMLIIVPVVMIGAVVYGLFVKKLAKQTQDALAKASEVAQEAIANLRTVRSFSKEDDEVRKYWERVDETYKLGRSKAIAYGSFAGIATLLVEMSFGGVMWYGAYLVLHEEMSLGQLTSFLLYTFSVAGAFAGMSVLYGDFMKAIGASEHVFGLLDRQPLIRYKGGIRPSRIEGRVEFTNIRFSYPSRPDALVLKGINFGLEPGKVVAVVGPSGGGKTTLTNLLEMFYSPNSGRITLDGEDIQKIDPMWLHEKIGVVSQGPCLFATTIRENICYGWNDAPEDKMVAASRMANAHEFISRFEGGYDTIVGERGILLSGGQKQRIAIARAILKDPKILLLDEATSDLDSESERLVQEALDRVMNGRTVMVIAHRLSTVRNAHLILVMKDGLIAEAGTHEQLMERGDVYYQLVSTQLSL